MSETPTPMDELERRVRVLEIRVRCLTDGHEWVHRELTTYPGKRVRHCIRCGRQEAHSEPSPGGWQRIGDTMQPAPQAPGS